MARLFTNPICNSIFVVDIQIERVCTGVHVQQNHTRVRTSARQITKRFDLSGRRVVILTPFKKCIPFFFLLLNYGLSVQ